MKDVPGTMLVIGAGAVGVEFASVYLRFGSKITLVEMMDRVTPIEDPDVSETLEASFKKQGMEVLTSTTVDFALGAKARRRTSRSKGKDGKEEKRTFDRVLVAVGRKPNTDKIGLDSIGVKVTKETVDVDAHFRTNVPGVWAIGDIIQGPWLAHAASHEGVQVMHDIAGKPARRADELRQGARTPRTAFPKSRALASPRRKLARRGTTSRRPSSPSWRSERLSSSARPRAS